jgi:hypothetical protein
MFRILSLDGGGIRGAFAAAFIARIEQELGHPITDHFDLIAGTSTGGIIALALGLGEPADRIRNLYEQRGPQIFTRRLTTALPAWQRTCLKIAKKKFPGIEEAGLHRSKYDSKGLADALREVYGIRTMEDATASRLVIPAVDLIYGRTVAFKTPHQPDFIRDRRLSVVDVALATTSAPTFFPHAVIGTGSAYTDGGLWANNPAIMGYVEAMKICKVCQRPNLDPPFSPDDVHMLSIGTGEPQYFAKPGPADDGLLWWGPRLFDVAGGAQSQGAHFQAQYLIGHDRYTRVDFKMPTEPWKLDDVSALKQLLHYGTQAAVDYYPKLRRTLLETSKPRYHPFPRG